MEPGSRRLRCDVIELAKAAEDVLGAQAEEALRRGIDIGLEEAGPIRVAGDDTMLREMLVNLVDNAIRYTPVGGKVTVSVTRLDGRALLTVEDVVPESIRWTASTFSSDFTEAWERRKRAAVRVSPSCEKS